MSVDSGFMEDPYDFIGIWGFLSEMGRWRMSEGRSQEAKKS